MTRLLALLLTVGCIGAMAQSNTKPRDSETVEPLRLPSPDNQFYVGFERTRYDYGLRDALASPITRAFTNGVNIQYGYRQMGHLSFVGTVRSGSGAPLGEKMATAAGGVGYVLHYKRYEPFVQLMSGYSRLTSQHAAGNIFLRNSPIGGFTTLFGGGVDLTLTRRWGVRPVYVENQYLPFGSKGSVYWNLGAGILYRFRQRH